MLRSLTGYGISTGEYQSCSITVEMKSVNHKYLDVSFRLPRILSKWELDFRNVIREKIKRGRVSVSINIEDTGGILKKLSFNEEMAHSYYSFLKKIGESLRLPFEITVRDFLFMKGIFEFEESEPDDELKAFIENLIDEAVDRLVEMKVEEGRFLEKDILRRLSTIEEHVAKIDAFKDKVVSSYRKKLEENFERIFSGKREFADEKRLEFEMVLFSDKVDISEEITRLKSHIEKFRNVCYSEEPPVGKKLDFILQEMNREINTIGAKNSIVEISELVIEVKTEIERIREQVQNIE